MEPKASQKAWSKVVAKTWLDEHFKKRFLADPKTVLKEHGIEVPAEVNVKVVENSGKTVYFLLPERPSSLSVDDLNLIAYTSGEGGGCLCQGTVGNCGP